MKKKMVSMLLVATMALGLVACGSSETSTTGTTGTSTSTGDASTGTDSNGSEEVVIKVFSNQADRTTGQGMVEQIIFDNYMEENLHVTIEVEALDDENYKTKFKAYATGTDMPDLVNVWGSPAFLYEVIDAGLIAELNPDDYADYNFLEGSLSGFSKDGKLYGLPRNTDVMGIYYNKAIFEECGVGIPETYEEYLETAAIIKENGYIPVSLAGSDGWPVAIYFNNIYQKIKGASAYGETVTAVATGDYTDAVWLQAAELAVETSNAGVFQAGFETTDYGTSLNLFTNGQAAMYYMGSWEMSMATNQDIAEEIRTNIGAFMMPVVSGGNAQTADICAWNGGGFAVTENSKVKEETMKLLDYIMLPDNWTRLCWENGVCQSAQNFGDYLTGDETSLQMEWVDLVQNATSVGGLTINDLGTNEFKTISEDASIEMMAGIITPEEFFQKLSSAVQ